jgi:hypothetical protein
MVFLVRNFMLGDWADQPFVSRVVLPVVLLGFSASYLLLKSGRRNPKWPTTGALPRAII